MRNHQPISSLQQPLQCRRNMIDAIASPPCLAEDGLDSLAGHDLVQSKPLVAAIARELWKIHGGNDVLNWLEAEMLLEDALADDPQQSDPARRAP